MSKAFVGVTDWDWYRFLRARGATEVNFWQPSGGQQFRALEPGAPFLFKTNYAHGNRVVGVGFFSGWAPLTISRAWEFFGLDNGCHDLTEMRARVSHYRKQRLAPGDDPQIGCIILNDVRFVNDAIAPSAPPDWSPNIVRGRTYDLTAPEGSHVEQALELILGEYERSAVGELPKSVPGPVFGGPSLTRARLGQGGFQALVQEAYGRRCAVTGDKIVPVLQAAHIQPVSQLGENRVDNGLLLRSDVHTLFDRGYVGVHPDRKTLLVSPRLRRDWGNGEEFYVRAGTGETIRMPERIADRPNREFLTWHTDTVFLAS